MSLNVEENDCPKLCNVTDTYMIKTQPIRASTSRDHTPLKKYTKLKVPGNCK